MVSGMITEVYEGSAGKMFKCVVCSKLSKLKHHIKNHVEIHVAGLSYTCSYCGKPFKSKNSLTSHVSRWHRQEKNDSPF